MRNGKVQSHNVDYFTLIRDADGQWKFVNGSYTTKPVPEHLPVRGDSMTAPRGWPVALLLVAGVCALLAKLAASPNIPRYSADECRDAYARAQTVADTHRVDVHPYGRVSGTGAHRCGETRAAAQSPPLVSVP